MDNDLGRAPSGQALVASDGAATHLHPSGFDPSRIASSLGKAQRKVVLSLGEDWGASVCHRTAKRMFWGIKGTKARSNPEPRFIYLVDHKHRTDNCWRLTDLGLAVKQAALAAATGTAKTAQQAECEASQSGGDSRNAHPSPSES